LKTIFISGTAGAGKSLLTSKLQEYYTKNGVFTAVLNLDPGVESLPYTCDIDVRDYVDIVSIMQQYDLGPNGALIMANDLIASKIDDIQNEVNRVNPDYLIVDTPGQIELFAYRTSGPFLVENISSEELFMHKIAKASIYSVATVKECYLTFMGKVEKSFLPIEKKQKVFEVIVELSINGGVSLEHCVKYYTPPLPRKKATLFERWKLKLWVWWKT